MRQDQDGRFSPVDTQIQIHMHTHTHTNTHTHIAWKKKKVIGSTSTFLLFSLPERLSATLSFSPFTNRTPRSSIHVPWTLFRGYTPHVYRIVFYSAMRASSCTPFSDSLDETLPLYRGIEASQSVMKLWSLSCALHFLTSEGKVTRGSRRR